MKIDMCSLRQLAPLLLAAATLGALPACRHDIDTGTAARDGTISDRGHDANAPGQAVWSGEITLSGTANPSAARPYEPWGKDDVDRSFLLCSFRTVDDPRDAAPASAPACELTEAGVVARNGNGAPVIVRWTVVQLPGASVQRGVAELTTSDVARSSIAQIDPTHSFILVSAFTDVAQPSGDQARLVTATIDKSGRRIEIIRDVSAVKTMAYWQVVTVPTARVFAGSTTMLTLGSTANATLPAFEASQSFVLTTLVASSAIGGVEADYFVHSYLDGGEVRFQRGRGTSAQLGISWQVVELTNATVQSNVEMDVGQQRSSALAPAVDKDRTFVLTSTSCATGPSMRSLRAHAYTAQLVGSSRPELLVRRAADDTRPRCFVATAAIELRSE